MSFFAKPSTPLKGGSPAAPTPQAAQAVETEKTLSAVRQKLGTRPPPTTPSLGGRLPAPPDAASLLAVGQTGGSSGAVPSTKRARLTPKRVGGGLPPSDVAAAALASTEAALQKLIGGGAPPKRPPRARPPLTGGAMGPGDALSQADFRGHDPHQNVYDGGRYVANNGITYRGLRHVKKQALAGVRPNVSHAYAPVGASYDATGLPGHVPAPVLDGLGTSFPDARLDGAVGQGGADIGDGSQGGAQRATAAKLAGAGMADDSDSDSSSCSSASITGGAITKATIRALETALLKQHRKLKRAKKYIKKTRPYESKAQKKARKEAKLLLERHGYSYSAPGSFGSSGLL